jgi:uncharacterized NAD(P)/FAD-binding protein YdhS
MRRVVIAGGGFTGAAAAVQLVRASPFPIAVTIVEPREELGRGMAYTAPDPDHRLNGNSDNHVTDIADPGELNRWCAANGLLERDPEAMARNGNLFIRRHDFGRFVGDQVRALADAPGGSTIRHRRDVAIDAWAEAGAARVATAEGEVLEADLVILATGNARPRLPSPLAETVGHDPRVIADPLEPSRVRAIPNEANVLLLGTGLTALDVASTLLRAGHRGTITAISRRGLRPRLHRLAPAIPGPTLLERVEGPMPDFVRDAPLTARGLLRALRLRIREVEAGGGTWYAAFDAMRDVLWQFWPRVPAEEKRRAQRWLRGWYDMHRFRAPPQNDAMVREAEAAGRVVFRAARVIAAEAQAEGVNVRLRPRGAAATSDERYGFLVNCTGLDPASGAHDNPLLGAVMDRGLVTLDPSGLGFAVDGECRPLARDGTAAEWMRMLGPPTAGVFGDPLGVLFIAPQVRRTVPGMLALLSAAPRNA